MKVTVSKYLNVRMGKPSVNAPCYQYLAPGSEIEVDGQLYRGDKYDGLDTWVKDLGGNYYWSGGVQENRLLSPYSWWIEEYEIDNLWQYTKGENVKVAILDSGIGINSNLKAKNIDGYNFTNNSSDYFDTTVGHGTHIAGIIAGQGPKVFGVAPDATLYVCKITDLAGKLSYSALMAALDKCKSLKVDIINLSFAITPADYRSNINILGNLSTVVSDLVKDKIFVVASCGNLGIPLDCYPACIPECISIAAIDKSGMPYSDGCSSATIDLATPGVEIFSTLPNNQFCNLTGTSQSAAFASGVLAAMKSYMLKKKKWDFDKLYSSFQDPLSLTAISDPNVQIGKGLINTFKLFDRVK
jgi:subtilisin family serine protease